MAGLLFYGHNEGVRPGHSLANYSDVTLAKTHNWKCGFQWNFYISELLHGMINEQAFCCLSWWLFL